MLSLLLVGVLFLGSLTSSAFNDRLASVAPRVSDWDFTIGLVLGLLDQEQKLPGSLVCSRT